MVYNGEKEQWVFIAQVGRGQRCPSPAHFSIGLKMGPMGHFKPVGKCQVQLKVQSINVFWICQTQAEPVMGRPMTNPNSNSLPRRAYLIKWVVLILIWHRFKFQPYISLDKIIIWYEFRKVLNFLRPLSQGLILDIFGQSLIPTTYPFKTYPSDWVYPVGPCDTKLNTNKLFCKPMVPMSSLHMVWHGRLW